ncbi:GLCT-1 [Cladobotryum mycophilum]|uniref:Ceramide glucosyltransferase n=1 Tax=Cladobotryum mycophilum TaxID=491253 RepID=A0ABR0SNL7_9HYPO
MTPLVEIAALVCLVWASIVLFIQFVGISAIYRHFSRKPQPPQASKLSHNAPVVTIIRPVKGLEPKLYECIASTFHQNYPRDKVSIRLCIEDKTDPAYPVLKKILDDFPAYDARILIENEDPALHGSSSQISNLGPNPKIRNISRAYREAKDDIIWVIDCNVWVSSGVLGRMVDRLMGFTAPGEPPALPFKFVHQMPLVVDLEDYTRSMTSEDQAFLSSPVEASPTTDPIVDGTPGTLDRILQTGGGRLDEMFMATSHVKFYCAINVVSIAPCIVGKSNMFRKSHLDLVTDPVHNPILSKNNARPPASNIPGFANHGIVWGDLALQPMAGMSIANYAARRVRWLRARKFTVLAATLVEPGIESFLCSAYLAFAVTTLPWFHDTFGIEQTWSSMALVWFISILSWMLIDWVLFRFLHTGKTVEIDPDTPGFARGTSNAFGMRKRPLLEWVAAWLGREVLALPVWTWAVLLGTTVNWRGKTFHVRLDTTVEELTNGAPARTTRTPELERARMPSKDRQD